MKTVKDYNLPLNSLKKTRKNKQCAILPSLCRHCQSKAKQSTAEYGRRLCLFCPSNKLTFDLLTLKVVSESRVTWATFCANFSLPRPLCSRLRSDVRLLGAGHNNPNVPNLHTYRESKKETLQMYYYCLNHHHQ